MSPVHLCAPRLLLLLHTTAATVLGNAMLNTTSGLLHVTNENTSAPGDKTSTIPEGAVRPTVHLYCLENGRKVLYCDPGTRQAASILWTLDGKGLEDIQASFQNNNNTMTVAGGVAGAISCTVRAGDRSLTSLPITPACDGDTWLFYSGIAVATGGGAFLLSLIVCATACCCRRRSGHLSVKQEEFELGPVFVEAQKKPKVEVVHEVDEATPITKKTTADVKPVDDDFQFPTPPDMDNFRPDQDGRATVGDGRKASAAGSEDSTDGDDGNVVDNGSTGVNGN